jgi:hypothetical protein
MADISTITSVPDYPAVADVKKDVVYGNGALTGLLAPSLPKTGQTTSYADYDDGSYKAGNSVDPRFVDNGDGTISDRATGLMWLKYAHKCIPGATGVTSDNLWTTDKGAWTNSTAYTKGEFAYDADPTPDTGWVCLVNHISASSGSFADARTATPTFWRQTIMYLGASGKGIPFMLVNWATAVQLASDLDFAGYTDWRLANFKEGASLISFGENISAFFPRWDFTHNFSSMNGWTSSTYLGDTTYAYYITFSDQTMYIQYAVKTTTTFSEHALICRGGI